MQHRVRPVILLEAIYIAMAFAPDVHTHLALFLALDLTAAIAAFVFAARATPRQALVAALLFRATIFFRPPDLSDDIRRYVWDGRLLAAGISPYAYRPDDPHLAAFRDSNWSVLPHKDARTVYPPAAEVVFAAAGLTRNPELALKAIFGLADVGIVGLLAAFPGGSFAAGLYAAFPLAVVESAGMGHVDSLGVALLLAALVALRFGRRATSGVTLALSAMVKLVPAVAAPALVRRGGIVLALAFTSCAGAIWIVGSAWGTPPSAGLANFAERWEGNSIVYPAVDRLVRLARLPERAKARYASWKNRQQTQKPWMDRPWPYFYDGYFSRLILAIAFMAGTLAILRRWREPLPACAATLALLFLLSPVFHPWYALWFLPFAALARKASLLYLCAAVPLAYGLSGGLAPLSPPMILALEYGPFAVLLARDLQ